MVNILQDARIVLAHGFLRYTVALRLGPLQLLPARHLESTFLHSAFTHLRNLTIMNLESALCVRLVDALRTGTEYGALVDALASVELNSMFEAKFTITPIYLICYNAEHTCSNL